MWECERSQEPRYSFPFFLGFLLCLHSIESIHQGAQEDSWYPICSVGRPKSTQGLLQSLGTPRELALLWNEVTEEEFSHF